MTRILVFLNRISHSSIPFELTIRVAEITEMKIVITSFYDKDLSVVDPIDDISDVPIEVRTLGGRSRFDPQAWNEFHNELKQGYDVVHTHHNFSGSVARLFATLEGIPIVDTEHRDHSSFSLLQNLINAPTLPLADRIISNSKITQDSFRWYERLLLNDDQLSVIHNGVNLERIQHGVTENPRSDSDTVLRVCTVGRMVPVKNQSTLLRAFSTVIEHYPNAELLLIGDGPLRDELESCVHDLRITDNIQFIGEVSRRRVYELLVSSDVFVISSHAEGFCVAAVEAMAAGLPVVASDIEVLHEVIGEPGVFADPDNPTEFADALIALAEDPDRRERLGTEAKERARSTFSLDRTAREYYNIYKELAENSE